MPGRTPKGPRYGLGRGADAQGCSIDAGPTRPFLAAFIGMFLSAAGLILSVPPLFGPHDGSAVTRTVVLAGLWAVLAAAALYLRPTRPDARRGRVDE